MTEAHHAIGIAPTRQKEFDVVVVGCGFAGLYMIHRLRGLGLSARGFETGDGPGGTWYWNRYPGARCDVESMQYSFSWDEKLQQDWKWSERYSPQPEILAYINHVADRFDLRKEFQFQTRVTKAKYDEEGERWHVETDRGDKVSCRFMIMCTGGLSAARVPTMKGLEHFKGNWYHTGDWPHEPVDFTGQRVGVIGTGSSGIQAIPVIAQQAKHVYVFQRTPNFSVPAWNGPLTDEQQKEWKKNYAAHRAKARETRAGILYDYGTMSAMDVTEEDRKKRYDVTWAKGGPGFTHTFNDNFLNKSSNDTAVAYVHAKIREVVKDPKVAELLSPQNHPIGTKRICVDTDYYKTFNRENVTLVDIRHSPIQEVAQNGLWTKDAHYELDSLVFATGYDAVTGAILRIDIHGRGDKTLAHKWEEGPKTYLGLMIAGFPNLFTVTGPGSPSVLTNVVVSIEQHVEWITELLGYMKKHNQDVIEPTPHAEAHWVEHVNEVADKTLFPLANSWYMGANIPGKPRVFLPYVGGFMNYAKICQDVVAENYRGFTLS
jgi:cyclohexanone monooxygenase